MKHKTAATVDGSGRCVFWNTEDLKWSGRGCSTISSNKTHTECTVSCESFEKILIDYI